jgi:hypothetical protein
MAVQGSTHPATLVERLKNLIATCLRGNQVAVDLDGSERVIEDVGVRDGAQDRQTEVIKRWLFPQ